MEQQSCSPKRSPIELRDCIEELVKFTLESSISQTLGFDLGLPEDFCLELLRENPRQPDSQLSSGSGELCGEYNKCVPCKEEYDNKLEQKELNDLGAELVNILKTINFELHVQEPFFTQLKDGLKTVEGRCAIGDYNRIGSGSLMLFNKCLVHGVLGVARYNSFSEMLKAEGLEKVLPGIATIEEGARVYRKFYTEEKERSNGVLAIRVAKSSAQPYIPLAKVLSGLGYNGVKAFLGHVHAS